MKTLTSVVALGLMLGFAAPGIAQEVIVFPNLVETATKPDAYNRADVCCGRGYAYADAWALSRTKPPELETSADVPPNPYHSNNWIKGAHPAEVHWHSEALGDGLGDAYAKANATAADGTPLPEACAACGFQCYNYYPFNQLPDGVRPPVISCRPKEDAAEAISYLGSLMELPLTGELWFVGQVERDGTPSDIALPVLGDLAFEPNLSGVTAPSGLVDTGLRVNVSFNAPDGVKGKCCDVHIFH